MRTLHTRDRHEVIVLEIEGRLVGGPETKDVCARVRSLVSAGRHRILLNLAAVPWANSLGIGTLVNCYVTARRQGAWLELCCLSDRVAMVLRTERIIPVLFDAFESEEEALAGFESARADDHPVPAPP